MSNVHRSNGCRASREYEAGRDNEDLQSMGFFLWEDRPVPGIIDSAIDQVYFLIVMN
jgi:hypothetical protein